MYWNSDNWKTILFGYELPKKLFNLLNNTLVSNDRDYEEFSLSNCYGFLFKSLMMMGWSDTPLSVRKRIAFLSIVVGSMVLYYLWEAMLISYFQTPKFSIPFNSLEEFLSKSDKKVIS